MNKFINILLLLISFPTLLFTIFVGFDLPVEFLKTTGKFIPFLKETFYTIGAIYFILIARRSMRRWMGIKMVKTESKFKWITPVGIERRNRVFLYQILEAFIMLFVSVALTVISEHALPISIALAFGVIDSIIFMFVGYGNKYKIGLTNKAILLADREVKVLYFNGLREISLHHGMIFFDYKDDLHLHFPANCIANDQKESFKQIVGEMINKDKVFVNESFRNF